MRLLTTFDNSCIFVIHICFNRILQIYINSCGSLQTIELTESFPKALARSPKRAERTPIMRGDYAEQKLNSGIADILKKLELFNSSFILLINEIKDLKLEQIQLRNQQTELANLIKNKK